MIDEYLYVVDDNDQVIGRRSRTEIHQSGLIHRAVHILIFNKQGELFLQKRSMAKDSNPGLWDSSAAGHVDYGESYDECAVRELEEELGIKLQKAPNSLFKLPASQATGMEFCQVYSLIHDGPFNLNNEEIETGRWYGMDDFTAWIESGGDGLTQTFKTIWGRLQQIRSI